MNDLQTIPNLAGFWGSGQILFTLAALITFAGVVAVLYVKVDKAKVAKGEKESEVAFFTGIALVALLLVLNIVLHLNHNHALADEIKIRAANYIESTEDIVLLEGRLSGADSFAELDPRNLTKGNFKGVTSEGDFVTVRIDWSNIDLKPLNENKALPETVETVKVTIEPTEPSDENSSDRLLN